jgi:sugar/nucleoside kinase (ribokinase family)
VEASPTVEAMTVLGRDDFGKLLCEAWGAAGVGTDRFVSMRSGHPTGAACLPVYAKDVRTPNSFDSFWKERNRQTDNQNENV